MPADRLPADETSDRDDRNGVDQCRREGEPRDPSLRVIRSTGCLMTLPERVFSSLFSTFAARPLATPTVPVAIQPTAEPER